MYCYDYEMYHIIKLLMYYYIHPSFLCISIHSYLSIISMHHIHLSYQCIISIYHISTSSPSNYIQISTSTGALPRKQLKVPYPMKLGLMKAKKKREQKALLEQKDSQVVLVATSSSNNMTSKSNNNVTNNNNKNYRRNSRR